MKRYLPFVVVVALLSSGMAHHPKNLSDVALRQYAMSFHDNRNWAAYPKSATTVGFYRDTRVIAEVRCSDICPDYTRMVIRYDVAPGPDCQATGGREVNVLMPFAIAVRNEKFCVPAALIAGNLYTAP